MQTKSSQINSVYNRLLEYTLGSIPQCAVWLIEIRMLMTISKYSNWSMYLRKLYVETEVEDLLLPDNWESQFDEG